MTKTIKARVQIKRDTNANWTEKNPVLLYGEKIYVDTAEGEVRSKVGDGSKTYTQLPFEDEIIRAKIENKADSSALNNYYTKDELENLELITTDDIDGICGATIQVATTSEVTF